jgi:hypothetical protein
VPAGVALDSAGNLSIAGGLSLIRKITPDGVISTVAGAPTAQGLQGFSGDGGPAVGAKLFDPGGVALDSTGNLYVADSGNSRIRHVSEDGVITTVVGNGQQDGLSTVVGDAGPGMAANVGLNGPQGLTFDTGGNLYIADTFYSRVRRVTPDVTITTVAGNGFPISLTGNSGDGGPATSAALFEPSSVAVDLDGSLYIAETLNHRIRKVSTNGTITTIAGNGTQGYSGDAGPATSAMLDSPAGVSVDGAGNIYIADWGNNRIRIVTPDGTINTIAGKGTKDFSGDGGPAGNGALNGPKRRCGGRRRPGIRGGLGQLSRALLTPLPQAGSGN